MVQGEMTRAKNDLAAAPFSGFAGFMDKSFRHHDYCLGRHNGQTFLRYYFGIPEKDIKEKLGEHPNDKAFDRFYFNESQFDENSIRLFPIIPDMRVLKARTNEVNTENFGTDANLKYPDYPFITENTFNKKYKKAIRKRIELVSNSLVSNFWFSVANRLFIRNKVSKEVESIILDELKDADLIR